jgi:acyl carrier protein
MGLFVEPYVRTLVGERLGVADADLESAVSLRGDLAADSLDMIDLAIALETEFAVDLSEDVIDHVRTYGELVEAIGLLLRARHDAEMPVALPSPRIWVRIVSAAGVAAGTFERAFRLTPYVEETISDDVRRAASGACVEVTVETSDAGVARLHGRLAEAVARGVRLVVSAPEVGPPPYAAMITETSPSFGDGAP